MTHVIITNMVSKRKVIENFMRSHDITNFIIFTETTELGELIQAMMVTSNETFNLHIFDFFGDISLTNAIRDYRDQINALSVFVSCIDDAKPYMTLTERVFILPDEYNIMSYFWDSDACLAKNVIAFETSGLNFFKLNLPDNLGKPKQLSIDVTTQLVPLKYKAANGMIVDTRGSQIVVDCKARTTDIKTKLKTRNQEIVYEREQPNLDDLAAEPLKEHEPVPEPTKEPIKPKPALTKKKKVKPPKPIKEKKEKAVKSQVERGSSDKVDKNTVFSSFFAKLSTKEEPQIEEAQAEKSEVAVEDNSLAEQLRAKLKNRVETTTHYVDDVQEESENVQPIENNKQTDTIKNEIAKDSEPKSSKYMTYIGFNNVKHGTEMSTGKASSFRFGLEEVYDSIAQYLVEKSLISKEDAAALSAEVEGKASKDALFGNLALERGFITDSQLIEAVTTVNHIEILHWDVIAKMDLDFTYFEVDKCKQFKFFKLKDAPGSDRVRIICAFSITSIHPEVRRLFNNPRISYTLDEYIARRLEEVS